MSEPEYIMSNEIMGLPRFFYHVWVGLSKTLIGVSIGQLLVLLPTLITFKLLLNTTVPVAETRYFVYAMTGWVALYGLATYRQMLTEGIEELIEFMRGLDWYHTVKVLALSLLYINSVVLIGAIAGTIVSNVTGFASIGVIVAMLYGYVDLLLASKKFSPGYAIILVFAKADQVLAGSSTSASRVVEGLGHGGARSQSNTPVKT